jgi:tetratricopeptide (TPR) repeat protein
LAGAEASLQKATSLNKNNLGVCAVEYGERAQGSIDKALSTAYKSIEQNPKSVAGYFLCRVAGSTRGNWQKAEALYQQALQVEPNYPPAANNLAYGMLEHKENIDIALSWSDSGKECQILLSPRTPWGGFTTKRASTVLPLTYC